MDLCLWLGGEERPRELGRVSAGAACAVAEKDHVQADAKWPVYVAALDAHRGAAGYLSSSVELPRPARARVSTASAGRAAALRADARRRGTSSMVSRGTARVSATSAE